MKRGLLMFRALTIVLAMIVSFGSYSVIAMAQDGGTTMPVHSNAASPDLHEIDCSQSDNTCGDAMSLHSDMNECCVVVSPAQAAGPTDPPVSLRRMALKTAPSASFGPPLRPPSIIS
jgi:hypothetical protein